MCIISDSESWPRLNFFNWTICDRALYCSTWLMLSEKHPGPMWVFRSYTVTSSSPRKRHDGCIVGTCGGIARRENLAQSATRSQSHAGTCWLISEALRTEEAFPLKLAAQRWGNLGYNEGGCTCGIFSNTKRHVHVFPLKYGAHMPTNIPRIQIWSLFGHHQPSLPSPMMRNPLWIQHNVYERRSPPD